MARRKTRPAYEPLGEGGGQLAGRRYRSTRPSICWPRCALRLLAKHSASPRRTTTPPTIMAIASGCASVSAAPAPMPCPSTPKMSERPDAMRKRNIAAVSPLKNCPKRKEAPLGGRRRARVPLPRLAGEGWGGGSRATLRRCEPLSAFTRRRPSPASGGRRRSFTPSRSNPSVNP